MSNLVKFLFCFCFTQLPVAPSNALDMQNIGVLYVQNYTKRDYLSSNKNWSDAKDRNGVMSFGSFGGLLAFNGSTGTFTICRTAIFAGLGYR